MSWRAVVDVALVLFALLMSWSRSRCSGGRINEQRVAAKSACGIRQWAGLTDLERTQVTHTLAAGHNHAGTATVRTQRVTPLWVVESAVSLLILLSIKSEDD